MTLDSHARQQLPKRALALVLAGGRGSKLKQLTDRRAKTGGVLRRQIPYRRLSAVQLPNSGIRQIGMVTQYKSHSLLRHLQHGWSFLKSEPPCVP